MAEIQDPGGSTTPPDPRDVSTPSPTTGERVNPSVEASRIDDELIAERRKNAIGAGTVGAGAAGCLGMALLPWAAVAGGIVAAIVIVVVMKSCQGS